MSDASLDFCERCNQPTYARALHDGVCDNCNPVPFLRARIAQLEAENSLIDAAEAAQQTLHARIAELEAILRVIKVEISFQTAGYTRRVLNLID